MSLEFPGEATPFQKVLIINLFKFEKTFIAVEKFIKETMGDIFAQNVNPILDEVFLDTDFKTPLIFILSPGADPLLSMLRYAKE